MYVDANHAGKRAYSDVLADYAECLNEKTCFVYYLCECLGVQVESLLNEISPRNGQ
jgi:hypothetical protein